MILKCDVNVNEKAYALVKGKDSFIVKLKCNIPPDKLEVAQEHDLHLSKIRGENSEKCKAQGFSI